MRLRGLIKEIEPLRNKARLRSRACVGGWELGPLAAVGRLHGGRRPTVPPRAGRGRRVCVPDRVVHALRRLAVRVWRLAVRTLRRVVHIRRVVWRQRQGGTTALIVKVQ